ncbi:hypothetical protein ACKGJO_07485 [Gracilimonas sp. Q87]|uniref:hypothetical protein n=1 Tax=Gracilimonas sp. Q87 TaxID=3384766 RepID=UPI00398400EE
MGQKNKYNNYSFESEIDGYADHDPNFDLDEYIRKMSGEEQMLTSQQYEEEEDDRSQFKNAILIFIVFAASYLWINDWNMSQTWNSIFGSDEAAFVSSSEVPSVDIPTIPSIPVNPMAPGEVNSQEFTEFLAAAQSNGAARFYSNIALQTMYESGVTMEYLKQLVAAGITDQSFPAVIAYHESGVTMEYLFLLKESGYLTNLSFPAVIAYFESGVTVEYLDQLNENDLLQGMNYPEVVNAYKSDN